MGRDSNFDVDTDSQLQSSTSKSLLFDQTALQQNEFITPEHWNKAVKTIFTTLARVFIGYSSQLCRIIILSYLKILDLINVCTANGDISDHTRGIQKRAGNF